MIQHSGFIYRCTQEHTRTQGPHSRAFLQCMALQEVACPGGYAQYESIVFRKLRTMSMPLLVMTLSGWNCTPCKGREGARTHTRAAHRQGSHGSTQKVAHSFLTTHYYSLLLTTFVIVSFFFFSGKWAHNSFPSKGHCDTCGSDVP